MINIEFLKEMMQEINDLNFDDDFKDFTHETFILFILCRMYEQMKEELITEKSLNEKLSILDFIKDIKPIISRLGIEIGIKRKIQKELIKDFYIPHMRTMMINH